MLHDDKMPELVLSGGEKITRVRTDEFLSNLSNEIRRRLVVLNTCQGGDGGTGPSATRLIAEHLRTVDIGWLGLIGDRDAVDFARFVYSRLLDGKTIVDALRSYRSIEPYKGHSDEATRDLGTVGHSRADDPIPVVWTAAISLRETPLRGLPDEEAAPARERAPRPRLGVGPTTRGMERLREEARPPVSSEPALPELDVVFEPQKWLNPALLKIGRPAINRLVLTPNRALSNVGIAVSCDTGHGISTVRQTRSLEKGPQPVPIEEWQFPVLYELIGADVPRRQVNFTVSCSLAGQLLAETTTSVLWMGRTGWLDQEDTWRYIPAYVDPYSDGVLDVVDKANTVLKTIAGPTSSFSAYQAADSGFVTKQVEAVFQCLRDKPFELSYIAPPPLAVYKPGDQLASGQRIRTPDEVVGRKRGTCHDLAILFASCLEHVQIYPLIILIWGHTFFGFWKDAKAHEDFWGQARNNRLRRPQDPGREWTITDLVEIRELLDRDVISLVEATKVTDRIASYAEAVQAGYDKLNEVRNPFLRFDVAVDIQASRRAVQPL
jgi:hypothetical protein